MAPIFEEIHPADLSAWADHIESDRQLPSLIRYLVLGSGATIQECRFLTNEETNTSGWDGITDAATEGLNVGQGKSGWELSKDKGIVAKAEQDISARSANPGELVVSETTFVAITLRRWPGRRINGHRQSSGEHKKAWADEEKAKHGWRNVVVLDSVDLTAWISAVPGAAIWLAQIMGRTVNGAVSLVSHWNDLSSLRAGLRPEVFLAGRSGFTMLLDKWITASPQAFEVQTWSLQDLKDALAAWWTIKTRDSGWLNPMMPVAVQSPNAWAQLTKTAKPLILLADEALDLRPEHISSATMRGHHVIYRTTAGRSRICGCALPPLSRDILADELQKSQVDYRHAWTLSSQAAGSGVALKRVLLGHSADPAWAKGEVARELAAVVLLGSWDGSVEGDRKQVETLFGKSYSEVEAILLSYAQADDPLVRRIDKTWRVVGREDAWRWLAPHLEDSTLNLYREQAVSVLSEVNPRYNLPPDRRIFASITGDVPTHSSRLRRAIAESLCLLALRAPAERTDEFVALARAIVSRVMTSARDWKAWASFGHALVFLAEAAPDVFLSCIERDLDSESSVTAQLFINGGDGLFSDIPHVDLMWALEGLFWQQQRVTRAILLLAKLAARDPGGNTNPRPMGVLREAFLPWLPQTCLDIAERCQALDSLMKVEPEIAWRLFLSLLPKTHDVSSPTHTPMYLPSQTRTGRTTNTKEYWHQVRHVATRLIELAHNKPEKWKSLIREFHQLPPEVLDAAIAAIAKEHNWTEEEKNHVWESLRAFIAEHRFYSSVKWRMNDARLTKVEALSRHLVPEESLQRNAWLFGSYSPHTPNTTADTPIDERKKLLKQERVRALNEVVASGGTVALRKFATRINQSGTAGALVAEEEILIDDTKILPNWLQSSDERVAEFARGYFAGRFFCEGWTWFDNLQPKSWGSDDLANLAQVFPFNTQTWARFTNFGAEFADKYWLRVQPYLRQSTTADTEQAINELTSRGRVAAAIQLIDSTRFEKNIQLSVELVLRVIESIGKRPEPTEEPIDPYQAGELIRGVQDFPTLNADQLKRLEKLEWAHLPHLKQNLEPKSLYRRILAEPTFFVGLLQIRPWRDDALPEARPELSDQQRVAIDTSDNVLAGLYRLPGQREDGSLNYEVFLKWIHEVRNLAAESGYGSTCEDRIGKLLLHSPLDPAGFWPCKPICSFLSEDSTDVTRDAFRIAIFNNQGWAGTHATGPLTSDMSERQKAVEILRNSATQIAIEFPLVAEILRSVATEAERFIHYRPLRDDE